METYFNDGEETAWDQLHEQVEGDCESYPEDAEQIRKDADLVSAVAEGYIEWSEENGSDEDYDILANEIMVEVPIPGMDGVFLLGKLDQLVLLPVADASARVAALRSGQVDWIEAPPPDAMDSLKSAGFAIASNVYPHVWPWHFSRLEGSPWNDIRVRKAANLAIDREGMKSLLGGMMVSAKGMVPPNSPWFGKPAFEVKYDVPAAKALMAQAGFSKDKPLKVRAIISPAGSGQMQPQLMNELIQQNLAEIGIAVEFDVRDWNALLANWRAGAKDPTTKGATATNSSYFSQDPFTALIRHVDGGLLPPKGTNWGYYVDKDMDALFDGVRTEFDTQAQLTLIQKAHEKFVNDALFLFVAHDVAPRAMTRKVKGFVPAQNWFLDFSTITMDR